MALSLEWSMFVLGAFFGFGAGIVFALYLTRGRKYLSKESKGDKK